MTAAIEYTLANHLAAMIVLGTGGAGSGGKIVTQGQLLGIYAGKAVLVYHMCLVGDTHTHTQSHIKGQCHHCGNAGLFCGRLQQDL